MGYTENIKKMEENKREILRLGKYCVAYQITISDLHKLITERTNEKLKEELEISLRGRK